MNVLVFQSLRGEKSSNADVFLTMFPVFLTATFIIHVRRSDVIALQNVKDPQSWLRIRNNQLEGNVSHCRLYTCMVHVYREVVPLVQGKGGRFCEFRVQENGNNK